MLKTLLSHVPTVNSHRGWPRVLVDPGTWRALGEALREGQLDLVGEWGEAAAVQCALYQPDVGKVYIASIDASSGKVPSLAVYHPPASRPERAIADLFGLHFVGLPDQRPWFDHGRWSSRTPLAAQSEPLTTAAPAQPRSTPVPSEAGADMAAPYRFLSAQGPSLHQVPVGPVHAGTIEPGHFRFTASGETVVRLEERLGYVHRGIEKLLAGKSVQAAAAIVARVCGDSTVAYSLAYARAVETALGAVPPPRAQWLRAIMAELERIANHVGDIGAICNDAAFSMMHAECGILREQTLRTCARAFGHRLMMDRIAPGGVIGDLAPEGAEAILSWIADLARQFSELIELYDSTASLQDRTVGTGVVTAELAAQFAAGGYVGRASGRAFDVRTALPYPPYDALPVRMMLCRDGDVDARVRLRILEVQESLRWLEAALPAIPSGPILSSIDQAAPMQAAGSRFEATALVEGFRGDILAYVRIAPALSVERCYLRDPSCFQWPLLEAAIYDNIVADFPLCNKSFNCAYAGHDL